jgi:membrane associated rhomboid family serine protease
MEAAQEKQLLPVEQTSRRSRFFNAATLPIIAVVLLWCIHLLDVVYELELYRFGILPRTLEGIKGIFASPFIHGDINHLFNNTLPVLFLGWGLMYFYPRIAGKVVLGAWLGANVWVWLSARQNYHIGASGVIYGMAAFLFTSGFLRRQRTLMALSLLIVFLYGSMVWGILPLVPRMSWEGHLWGMVAGIAMAFLYRHVPPAVSDPKPVTFDEDEEDDELTHVPHDDISGLGSAPLHIVRDRHGDEGGQAPDDREAGRQQPGGSGTSSNSWSNGNLPRS